MRRPPTLIAAALIAALALSIAGCGDQSSSQPPSLEAPHAVAKALRSDCGEASATLANFNDSDGRCSIGLVANAGSDRLAVMDLGRSLPALADLDASIPSATHLKVGRRPVDVEASADGTVAYTLNTISNELSVVDLWRLETLDTSISLPATARSLETAPGPSPGGRLIAALDDPDQLWFRSGATCAPPGADSAGCSGLEADAETVGLPARAAELAVGPGGGLLYVVYQDRNYMSVFALPTGTPLEERGVSCRRSVGGPPCEVERVGLTYGCSDGVDNDGDGRIDQRDRQCWGPSGAESPDGAGRTPRTVCNDGVDNDGDGAVDRADEECQAAADDSERELLNEEAEFPCSNGVDEDGDGATDYPEDSSCYGPHGRTESALESTGFESVAVDRMGAFVYVVDRANDQVLTVATDRMQLVDAGRTVEPAAAPFDSRLGVTVGSRPTDVAGFVSREILWQESGDPSHGIVRYTFGAYVASDDGRTYFVESVASECEVREPDRSSLLSADQFRYGGEAFEQSAERDCIAFPEFPLEKTDNSGNLVDACEQTRACLDCVENQSFEACRAKCDDFGGNSLECRAAGRELQPSMQTRLVVNPKFGLRDSNGTTGRLQGRGRCEAPELYEDQLQSYADQNPDTPRNFTCDSPLRPQPLTPLASDSDLDADTFESIPRARLLREVSVRMRPPSEQRSSVTTGIHTRIFDFRLRDETWRVTWEGVLPNTDRNDGLLAKTTRETTIGGDSKKVVDFDPGGVDLCRSGARAGDRVILRTKPKTGEDAPDACSGLTTDESRESGDGTPDNADPFRTYRIAEIGPDNAVLQVIGAGADGVSYSQTLPIRKCFPTGINYQIRAEDAWIVRGEKSGFVSERTSELGRCVPAYDAGTERLGGRVEEGGLHVGPYLSFFLYNGSVRPIRRPETSFEYEFSVQRFFGANSFETGTILPSDMLLVRDANRGVKLLVSDSSNDFVWGHNFARQKKASFRLR